jgi:hypothetical protein
LTPEARGALTEVRPGFVSLGHAGGQLKATIKKKDGALWVAEHRRVSDDGEGPVLAIEARGSDWCYIVAEPSGTVLRSGALADCAGCHNGAGASPIFTQ